MCRRSACQTLHRLLWARPRVSWAHTVAPVVAIREASAGPADDGRFQALEVVNDSFPNAADIGDLRILSHPNAIVNAAAEMFREVSVNVRRDGSDLLIRKDVDSGGRGARRASAHQRQPGKEELSSVHSVDYKPRANGGFCRGTVR